MPNVYRAVGVIVPRRVHEALEVPQVADGDEGLVGRPGACAGGPIEHPLRQFERPARLVVLEMAAEHGEMTPPDPLNDDHLPTEPGVPGVMDLAGFGNVGLLSRCCRLGFVSGNGLGFVSGAMGFGFVSGDGLALFRAMGVALFRARWAWLRFGRWAGAGVGSVEARA